MLYKNQNSSERFLRENIMKENNLIGNGKSRNNNDDDSEVDEKEGQNNNENNEIENQLNDDDSIISQLIVNNNGNNDHISNNNNDDNESNKIILNKIENKMDDNKILQEKIKKEEIKLKNRIKSAARISRLQVLEEEKRILRLALEECSAECSEINFGEPSSSGVNLQNVLKSDSFEKLSSLPSSLPSCLPQSASSSLLINKSKSDSKELSRSKSEEHSLLQESSLVLASRSNSLRSNSGIKIQGPRYGI